jgi:hypothetical protein
MRHTKETKERLSRAALGRKHKESTKQMIGDANKTRIWSEESRLKAKLSAKLRWKREHGSHL